MNRTEANKKVLDIFQNSEVRLIEWMWRVTSFLACTRS